jgi:hypothetical protein
MPRSASAATRTASSALIVASDGLAVEDLCCHGANPPTPSSGSTNAGLPPIRTLPGGGTRVFPDHRLVGYSGYPGSPALGRLGVGALDDRATEITALASEYAAGRRPLPVLELIATVVHAKPGPDGLYRTRIDQEIVRRHLDAARRHGAILLLNIQPGRAAFLDEVKHWEPWLREPDVGLALDPEWAVKAGQVPGTVFGRTTGRGRDPRACAQGLQAVLRRGHRHGAADDADPGARTHAAAGIHPLRVTAAPAGQWAKCRVPVKYIVTPAAVAAATVSASRIDPPGLRRSRGPPRR